METVEVVIKMPKEDYMFIKTMVENGYETPSSYYYNIASGIVLPKGHDALLDAGQLMNYCHNQIEGHKYVDCNVIARFPCVIKADKAGDTDD